MDRSPFLFGPARREAPTGRIHRTEISHKLPLPVLPDSGQLTARAGVLPARADGGHPVAPENGLVPVNEQY